jgi:hypothetical protein
VATEEQGCDDFITCLPTRLNPVESSKQVGYFLGLRVLVELCTGLVFFLEVVAGLADSPGLAFLQYLLMTAMSSKSLS